MRIEHYAVVDGPNDREITWTTHSYAEARSHAERIGGCVLALTFETVDVELTDDLRERDADAGDGAP
jgi:hypothetical protein